MNKGVCRIKNMVVSSKELLAGMEFIKACRDPIKQYAILDALNDIDAQKEQEGAENGD